ncbi:MAG: NAD(P)-dependent oxidoreductase [Actinomycetia bacterium]|nr:NAD(P)-dependent oxidoreductase [Actinomycetes bacterium]
MRALVIGGSGLFGKKTCLALLNDPDFERVVAFDIAPPSEVFLKGAAAHGDRFAFVRGDVSDLEQVLAAASTNAVDRIVNWAMILAKDPRPRENTKVGVVGMCNVFEAARLLGIKRVVYASSETVYGEQKDYGDREVREDDRLLPFTGSFYALAKCLAEVIASQYDELYGVKPTALRPTIGYGHGGKDPKFVRWFSEIVSLPAIGLPVHLECTGDWLFSLVKSDDVAQFARLALRAPSSPHPAYNLGGPPTSLKDVAAVVKKYIPDARITFGNEPEDCELPWKVNCDLAKQDFGFEVKPLDEAVRLHIAEARLEAGLQPLEL